MLVKQLSFLLLHSKERRAMMTKDMKDLLRVLNAHAVEYLVIGG